MNNTGGDPYLKVQQLLDKQVSGIICLPENPSLDATASAIALYHGLTKLGKNVAIVCSGTVSHELPGTDKIQSNITTSGNNLVISLPYTDGSIDRVDYNIQGDRFNLVISPKEGHSKLSSDDVKYTYSGGSVDFIVTMDVPSLRSLGLLYEENQNQFEGKTIVNIDRHLNNAYFGTVNLVAKTSSSLAELTLAVLRALKSEIDQEIATLLYGGLTKATNNFGSYSVNPATFETAAYLLKLGAKKAPSRIPGREFSQPRPVPSFPQNANNFPEQEKRPVKPKAIEMTKSQDQIKPVEEVEQETQPSDSNETPEDWLKPKIFHGNKGGMS